MTVQRNETALHIAAERGKADVVKLLADAGANLNEKGRVGVS